MAATLNVKPADGAREGEQAAVSGQQHRRGRPGGGCRRLPPHTQGLTWLRRPLLPANWAPVPLPQHRQSAQEGEREGGAERHSPHRPSLLAHASAPGAPQLPRGRAIGCWAAGARKTKRPLCCAAFAGHSRATLMDCLKSCTQARGVRCSAAATALAAPHADRSASRGLLDVHSPPAPRLLHPHPLLMPVHNEAPSYTQSPLMTAPAPGVKAAR